MEYRQLGSSDLRPSVIGMGGFPFGPPLLDQAMTTRVLDQALDLGVNYIDTSDIYAGGRSEEFIGAAIKGKRERFILASKFNLRELGEETPRQRITRKCEESLRKLQTDHMDLYQIHQAAPWATPEEIMRPLDDLVRQGKVRYVGACNYASWRHMEAQATATQHGLSPFVSTQNHYNLLYRHVELELLPFCRAYNVGFIPYFPLAGGFLTGAYRPGAPPPPGSRADIQPMGIVGRIRSHRTEQLLVQLEEFAQGHGHPVGELALAWLLSHPELTVAITGSDNPEHVAANIRAAEWRLTPEERAEVDAITSWWDGAGAAVDTTGGPPAARPVGPVRPASAAAVLLDCRQTASVWFPRPPCGLQSFRQDRDRWQERTTHPRSPGRRPRTGSAGTGRRAGPLPERTDERCLRH